MFKTKLRDGEMLGICFPVIVGTTSTLGHQAPAELLPTSWQPSDLGMQRSGKQMYYLAV